MAVTMTRVAKEVGVSVAVVSRLLRKDPTLRISEKRRSAILDATNRLGGVDVRQRRRRQLTRTVVMPVNRIFTPEWMATNWFCQQMVSSFESALGVQRYKLLYSFFDSGQEVEAVRAIATGDVNCDGLFFSSGIISDEVADIIRSHGVPHISNDFHAERFEINTVRANTADGMRQAVEHLRDLGHQRIAFIGPRNSYRYPLLVAAMAEVGLSTDESQQCFVSRLPAGRDHTQWRPAARDAALSWLDQRNGVTAVVGSNDWFALGMVDAMRQKGIKPGRDLSVVGGDNFEERSEPVDKPILTTIDNPFDQIGRRLAERLFNQIQYDQMQISHESIPAPLIIRQSTGPVPSPL